MPMNVTDQKNRIVRKNVRVRDIPAAWNVRALGEPDTTVTVTIVPTSSTPSRPLGSYIGAGKGVYGSAAEADAHIRKERNAWEE